MHFEPRNSLLSRAGSDLNNDFFFLSFPFFIRNKKNNNIRIKKGGDGTLNVWDSVKLEIIGNILKIYIK